MYRKIIFITVTVMQDADINTRATLLLFFAAFFYISTKMYNPFVLRELNVLEGFSNVAALTNLFFGCLYVLSIDEPFKFLFYCFILMINIYFMLRWFFAVFRLVLNTHREFIDKYLPNFVDRFYEIQDKIFNMSLKSLKMSSLRTDRDSDSLRSSKNGLKGLQTRIVKINLK